MTDVTVIPLTYRAEPHSTWSIRPPRLRSDVSLPGGTAPMSTKNDRQKLLSEVALFSACTDRELDRLARHAELVDFRAGEVLMTEGQSGHEFYAIVEGEVGVTTGS